MNKCTQKKKGFTTVQYNRDKDQYDIQKQYKKNK